jgi:tetratricopeptide (TPR) repeat protein
MNLRHDVTLIAVRDLRVVALRCLVFLSALCAVQPARADHAQPYIPANASVVLQLVPPTTDPRVRQFELLRQQFEQQHDQTRALALARAYIDYGRATGDARYLGRAMAVITPFWNVPHPPVAVMLVHATIQQSRHFFRDARAELQLALQREPDNAQAWLTLATVAMVQGDHQLANDACVHLANASSDFMGMVCTASLRSLDGHGEQAYVLLSMIEDPGPKAPPAIRAWLEGLMADTAARMGRADVADAHFRKALQWTPGDNFLLADYGEFLLDQHRAKEAAELVRSDSTSDTSFLILATSEAMQGLPQARADIDEMDARFRSMDQRGDHVFLREEASFLLHVQHDPRQALALAKQNWIEQRAPKDVRVYLEAAIASGDPQAAQPALDFIRSTGLADVTLVPLQQQLQAMHGGAAAASMASAR